MWARAYKLEYADSQSNRAIIIDILWSYWKNYFALRSFGTPVFFIFAEENHKLKQL